MNSILRTPTIAICVTFFLSIAAVAQDLGLPLDCAAAGVECRIQQYVDMDTGPSSLDPYCSTATYNGHDGTDIRVLSMRDVEKGVSVIAMADGKVLRGRDGEPDRLVTSEGDRAIVANKECGNGLLVEQGAYQVQYCHMRQGSIVVKPGDSVSRGQKLGEIGASGLAQFPHVHITVRKQNATVDPMTGATPRTGHDCIADAVPDRPLWSADARKDLAAMAVPLLDAGISGSVPVHDRLSLEGGPISATSADAATIGWVWFANLQKGDQIKLTLRTPDGSVYSESLTEPLDRNKADYSAYIGRKRAPIAGEWTLDIALMRGGAAVFETSKKTAVE
jgi:Peptidase family M23